MVNSNANAIGIIFPNSYDALVPELSNVRLMASIPFASRYRMIDFILSSMVNCGISNVTVLVRNNYSSLMDHLGSGREWDLTAHYFATGQLKFDPGFIYKKIPMSQTQEAFQLFKTPGLVKGKILLSNEEE